eukprot:364798-Chlamydomonas_euryale.AAC.1
MVARVGHVKRVPWQRGRRACPWRRHPDHLRREDALLLRGLERAPTGLLVLQHVRAASRRLCPSSRPGLRQLCRGSARARLVAILSRLIGQRAAVRPHRRIAASC